MDRRSKARELAMQALCQLDVQGDDILPRLSSFFRENTDDSLIYKLAQKWAEGTWRQLAECDDTIIAAAVRWKLSRLSQVDRSILRLSVFQLKFCTDIPGKVIINEAIELAKKYSTEQSPRFVNGVLDAVLKKNISTSPEQVTDE